MNAFGQGSQSSLCHNTEFQVNSSEKGELEAEAANMTLNRGRGQV